MPESNPLHIRHEFRESHGKRFHRLVQAGEAGLWEPTSQCAYLFPYWAAPEGLLNLPEVFTYTSVCAEIIEPKPIGQADGWEPTS